MTDEFRKDPSSTHRRKWASLTPQKRTFVGPRCQILHGRRQVHIECVIKTDPGVYRYRYLPTPLNYRRPSDFPTSLASTDVPAQPTSPQIHRHLLYLPTSSARLPTPVQICRRCGLSDYCDVTFRTHSYWPNQHRPSFTYNSATVLHKPYKFS